MYEIANCRSARCSHCGRFLKEGEAYAENNETVLCADCAEELDLCDVLEFLELEHVLGLLGRVPDCVKRVR